MVERAEADSQGVKNSLRSARAAMTDNAEQPLSLVLFSGTEDKLQAAAVLTAGTTTE